MRRVVVVAMVIELLNRLQQTKPLHEVFLGHSSLRDLLGGKDKCVRGSDEDLALINHDISLHVKGAPADFNDPGAEVDIGLDPTN